ADRDREQHLLRAQLDVRVGRAVLRWPRRRATAALPEAGHGKRHDDCDHHEGRSDAWSNAHSAILQPGPALSTSGRRAHVLRTHESRTPRPAYVRILHV